MAKWKEVSAYTGENVEEDAPTNNAGSGAVSMPPDAMMKKKKSLWIYCFSKVISYYTI